MADELSGYETLTVEVEGQLGRLTLNQPERLNPLGSAVLRELAQAAAAFDVSEVTVVIVSGAGRAFSAGFDLREFGAPADAGADPVSRAASVPELGAAMAHAVASMRAVTIAAVRGPCLGGGLVLALACDLRVAADDAFFSLPEADLGIPLAWTGVPRLVREIGPSHALELILTCRRIGASEALALGLLNHVVPGADLLDVVDDLAGKLASQGHSVLTTTKRQVAAAAEALVPTTGAWAGTAELLEALRRARQPPLPG